MTTAVAAFAYISSERNTMDGLFSANVEALARNESGMDRMCVSQPTPGPDYKILCATCEPGYVTVYSYSFCDVR